MHVSTVSAAETAMRCEPQPLQLNREHRAEEKLGSMSDAVLKDIGVAGSAIPWIARTRSDPFRGHGDRQGRGSCTLEAKAPDRLVSAFSGVPSGRRYEAWREEICRSFTRLDVEPGAGDEIDCEVDIVQLSSLSLGVPKGTSARFARSHELLSDSCDDLVLVMGTFGRTVITQNDRSTELAPSEMYMLEMNAIGAATITDENRFATVRMPRRALLSLCPGAEDCLSKPLLENRPVRELIARYFALSAEVAINLDPVAQKLSAQHLIDLVALLLGTERDETELATQRGYSASRLRLIEEDIVAHVADNDLTIASTARRQGMSPKKLQRMFERAGKTFTEFVLEQRLTRARRLLTMHSDRSKKIAVLAFAAGFSDLSYFNRVFRKRFGVTPSEWRGLLHHSTPA